MMCSKLRRAGAAKGELAQLTAGHGCELSTESKSGSVSATLRLDGQSAGFSVSSAW